MPASPACCVHAIRIAGYNRRLYVVGFAVATAGTVVACLPAVPWPVRWLGGAAAVVAVWFAAASFLAFRWMFDRSELLGGLWLADLLAESPRRWVQINAGLEETTLPMPEAFPAAEGRTLDLYHPTVTTEPALGRARGDRPQAAATIRPDALPVDDAWADLVVVTLAAHEIRDPRNRERFFRELRRIVAPRGRVVVVEHLRDLAAALAFGPGLLHFYPRSEWLRLARSSALEPDRERRITPFVRVFVFRPVAEAPP